MPTPPIPVRVRPLAVALAALATAAAGPTTRPATKPAPTDDGRAIFFDTFDESSRGPRVRNRVVDAPPAGMGYTTDTPFGYELKNWIIADAEADGPRRSFWCVPETADGKVEAFARQAARSHDSIAFVKTQLPPDAARYAIEFRQWCNDNDYIGFVLGASNPEMKHDGVEFGYERQEPGTDNTVDAVHHRGALGKGKIDGHAAMKRWAAHRIDVDLAAKRVRWTQDGQTLLEGDAPALNPGGHFGIRQRYERGTRYDDVKIKIPHPAAPPTENH
jgi:hypothetical protein